MDEPKFVVLTFNLSDTDIAVVAWILSKPVELVTENDIATVTRAMVAQQMEAAYDRMRFEAGTPLRD